MGGSTTSAVLSENPSKEICLRVLSLPIVLPLIRPGCYTCGQARQVAPDPDPEDHVDPEVFVCLGNCPGPFKMSGKEIPVYGHFGCAPTLREYQKLMVSRIGLPRTAVRFYQAPTFQHPAPQVKCPRPAGNVLGQFDHPKRFLVVIKYTLVYYINRFHICLVFANVY